MFCFQRASHRWALFCYPILDKMSMGVFDPNPREGTETPQTAL